MALPFYFQDFRGGLNVKDAPDLLTDNEARDLSNVQGTTSGAIVKRNGLQTVATPPQALSSLFAMEAATSRLVGAGGDSLYSISSGGTVTAIKTGLTAGKRWEFVTAPVVSTQGPLFGVNGTDTPQQWTGTGTSNTWSAATGAVNVPNGKYCLTHQNQVFIAGVAATPSRVYWSAISDPTNWDPASLTGAGSMDFDPNDGQAITGIGRVGPYVLVCKPRKLFVLADPATATVRRLSDNVGCVAHRSIASGPEGTYFLSEDRGVYVTNGSSLNPISDKILPTIQGATGAATAAGVHYAGHYYLSLSLNPQAGAGADVSVGTTDYFGASDGSTFGGSGTFGSGAAPPPGTALANDTTLDYDTTLGSWWKHSFGSNQFAIWHPAGIAALYSAKATAALVDQCFVAGVNVDNGSQFVWRWAGPWQSPSFYRRRRFPTTYFRKRLRQIRMEGAGTVNFSLAKDFASVETLLHSNIFAQDSSSDTFGGTGVFGVDGVFAGVPSTTRAQFYSLGVANAFSVVFSSMSSTQDTLYTYTMMMTDRRDRVPA